MLEKAVSLDEVSEPQITRSLTLIAYVEALVLAGEFDQALTTLTDLLERTGASANARQKPTPAGWRRRSMPRALTILKPARE